MQFLMDQLEEESLDDTDYDINQATVDSFDDLGAPAGLADVLRRGLGGREEMDIHWER